MATTFDAVQGLARRAAGTIFPTTAKRMAALAVSLARDPKSSPADAATPYTHRAGAAMVEAHTEAQVANKLARPAARYRRKKGRADALRQELDRKPQAEVPAWLTTLEPLVSSLPVVVATVWLAGMVLEALGTLPSLAIFSSTIGEGVEIPVLVISIGACVVLLGHFAGWLLELAGKAQKGVRIVLALGAAVLLFTASGAILKVGEGRDTNLRASGQLTTSGLLVAEANRLDADAEDMERRLRRAGSDREFSTPQTEAMRQRAEEMRGEAETLKKEAFDGRDLGFFVWVQFAALALAVVAGWAFSLCSPLRLARRVTRLDKKAARLWGRAWNRCEVIAALAWQTIALATIHAGQGGGPYAPRDDQFIERLFFKVMEPPASAPTPLAPRRSPAESLGLPITYWPPAQPPARNGTSNGAQLARTS